MKKFNNVHNKSYNIDGKIVWESRSVAVVGIIILLKDLEFYALITKRGIGAAPPQGKWCNVCGYLDWEESGYSGLSREVYEESGLDIDDILENKQIFKQYLDQPFFVNTDPKENRQNISLTYALVFASDEFPKTTSEYSEPNEIEEIKWVNIKDIDKYDFAFNHNERIKMFIKKELTWFKRTLYKICCVH
jgi:8-oxo-dGTP pyrophosphatase MutT (NUDIX family)